MNSKLNELLAKLKSLKIQTRKAAAIITALSICVATLVSWELRATGISLAGDAYCGQEEHEHQDSCYEEILICCQEEGHKHGDECYDENGNLICTLEENHKHTDECYRKLLICEKEEHVHTLDCYSDETADVETEEEWTADLPELTGDLAADIAAVAASQVGYTESEKNYIVDDEGNKHGYTRYGDWYGNKYGDWNVMFAAWVLHYAGADEEKVPYNSGAEAWIVQLKEKGLIYEVSDEEEVELKAGDFVFMDTDNDEESKPDSVGIISEDKDTDRKLNLISGDKENAVKSSDYVDKTNLKYILRLVKNEEGEISAEVNNTVEEEIRDSEKNSQETSEIMTFEDPDTDSVEVQTGISALNTEAEPNNTAQDETIEEEADIAELINEITLDEEFYVNGMTSSTIVQVPFTA